MEAGDAKVPVGRVYGLDEIVTAHEDMEVGRVGGKAVVDLSGGGSASAGSRPSDA